MGLLENLCTFCEVSRKSYKMTTVDSTIANHLEAKRYYFKHDHGNVILFGTKYILHISAFQENNNFSSFDFLMGDNSVDIIPPALDNGEPTRQWRIK